MAAVTRVKGRPCAPVGYEVNDTGAFAAAAGTVLAGDLLVITNEVPPAGHEKVWGKAPAGATAAHGIALMDGYAGGTASVGIQGEMDGFSGMTPGAAAYPSATVAGGLDTTAPTYVATTPPVPALPLIRAVTASRIRFSFV